nr:immunoglobulin heavy chain junction region [Macaca mulatta]
CARESGGTLYFYTLFPW